ncbi:MAG: DUF3990 domain-containing protein, partial [Bacteroidaceae bacterium]|nr:DUF3990 domain-containing protein [Bacteroidaceae bacterium]
MILYHGSIDIVENPEIRIPSRTLDYGSGFYTTTSFRQAEDWVRRKLNANTLVGYVNVYEFDETLMNSLNAMLFEYPTEEWVDFVMNNRTNKDFYHDFDIVYGPVANDKVYAAFALYEGGIIDKQNLISELKAYKLVDQYLFHTDKAVKALKFIEA